jgi:hypothetical protein
MTNDDRKIREKLQQKTWNEIKKYQGLPHVFNT